MSNETSARVEGESGGRMLRHGVDCGKAVHDPKKSGYEHTADHDGVYDVDGVPYCGRCHYWMGCDVKPKVGESGLSDGEVVKQVYPDASVWRHGSWRDGFAIWKIYDTKHVHDKSQVLGIGESEEAAWADARARIEAKPEPLPNTRQEDLSPLREDTVVFRYDGLEAITQACGLLDVIKQEWAEMWTDHDQAVREGLSRILSTSLYAKETEQAKVEEQDGEQELPLIEAVEAFFGKLSQIEPVINGMIGLNFARTGQQYNGPNYSDERAAVLEIIKRLKEESVAPPSLPTQTPMKDDGAIGQIRRLLTETAIACGKRKGHDRPDINDLYSAAISIIASRAAAPVALPTHREVGLKIQAAGYVELRCSCGRTFIGAGDDGLARSRASFEAHLPGVSKFFGTWPGDETDSDLLAALDEIRKPAPVEAKGTGEDRPRDTSKDVRTGFICAEWVQHSEGPILNFETMKRRQVVYRCDRPDGHKGDHVDKVLGVNWPAGLPEKEGK